MCYSTNLSGRGVITALAAALLLGHAGRATAETLLRWKLHPDQSLRIRFEQSIRTETTGTGKPAKISIDLLTELKWHVVEVDGAGSARVMQTLDRFAVTMTGSGAPIEYDSATGVTPSGPARDVAEAVAPLIGAGLQLTMNDRGEFSEVRPVPQGAQSPPAETPSALLALLSPQGISGLLERSAAVLPAEALEDGAQWTAESLIDSRLGKLQQQHTYKYAGRSEHEGQPRERIDVTTEVQLVEPPASDASATSTLSQQKHSGVLWFDAQEGRYVASELTQSFAVQRPYRELRIRVQTETTTKMTVFDG